jgi:hypothetical protein
MPRGYDRAHSGRLRYLLPLCALFCSTLLSSSANAATILFSFSNDPSWGNVSGTVTGEIDGLVDNSTSAATAVIIDSYPAGLVLSGTYTTPFDVLAWSGGTIGENSFTLSGGVLIDGNFSIFSANGINDQLYLNSQCCGGVGTNFLDIGSNDTLYVWNRNGIGPTGVTFSSTSGVPEPASEMLVGTGVLGLLFLRRKAKP